MAKKTTTKEPSPAPTLLPQDPTDPGTALAKLGIDQDESMTILEGILEVSRFRAGIIKFFTDVLALEQAAKNYEIASRVWKAPTSKEEDERLQKEIIKGSDQEKAVEAGWSITAVISRFHRKMTGRRKVSEDALALGKKRLQALHDGWVAAEKRRVDEVNRLAREKAERDERARIEREADDLERAALQAEAGNTELSERERIFVEAYVAGKQADIAARQAGYKDPFKQCVKLLQQEKIARAIEGLRTAAIAREQAEAVRQQPVEVNIVEEEAQLGDAGTDVETWKAVIVDPVAFREAVIAGKHGIPHDTLEPSQGALTQHARQLKALMNTWPGVKAVKTTTTRR